MTPPAQRKAAERQRRKDAGLVRVEAWLRPEEIAALKAFIAKLEADRTAPQSRTPA